MQIYRINIKKVLNVLGLALSILSIYYIFVYLTKITSNTSPPTDIKNNIFIYSAFFIYFLIISLLPAIAWGLLLQSKRSTFKASENLKIYLFTQIYKYIPGNVFHFAGRYLFTRALNVRSKKITSSTILELIIQSIIGLLFLGLLTLNIFNICNINQCFTLYILITVLVFFLLKKIKGINASYSFLLHSLFLLLTSLIFILIVSLNNPNYISIYKNYFELSCIFISGWFIGMIIPGSPAGLGVRELTILKLMHIIFEGAQIGNALLISRLVTILGEFFYFILFSRKFILNTFIQPRLKHKKIP